MLTEWCACDSFCVSQHEILRLRQGELLCFQIVSRSQTELTVWLRCQLHQPISLTVRFNVLFRFDCFVSSVSVAFGTATAPLSRFTIPVALWYRYACCSDRSFGRRAVCFALPGPWRHRLIVGCSFDVINHHCRNLQFRWRCGTGMLAAATAPLGGELFALRCQGHGAIGWLLDALLMS